MAEHPLSVLSTFFKKNAVPLRHGCFKVFLCLGIGGIRECFFGPGDECVQTVVNLGAIDGTRLIEASVKLEAYVPGTLAVNGGELLWSADLASANSDVLNPLEFVAFMERTTLFLDAVLYLMRGHPEATYEDILVRCWDQELSLG